MSQRVAGPEDAEAIGAVLGASYPKLMAPAYPADVLARALPFMVRANPALLRSGTYYLAATPDGTAVGCGGWTFERPGEPSSAIDPTQGHIIDPTQGHIRHFATHPDWIRHGIGRALFERCVAEARAVGVQRFECYASIVAQPFYAALGFMVVGPITIELEPGLTFPSLRMICHCITRASDQPSHLAGSKALADRGRVLTCEGLYEGCFNSDGPAGGAASGGHHCRLLESPLLSGMDAPAGLGAYGEDAVFMTWAPALMPERRAACPSRRVDERELGGLAAALGHVRRIRGTWKWVPGLKAISCPS